jgi:hypothetical protein
MTMLELPVLGNNQYRLRFFNGLPDQPVVGGARITFPAAVDHFQVLDIEEDPEFDPNDPRTFVAWLNFTGRGPVNLTMTQLITGGGTSTPLSVTIDIKPGSLDDPTTVNINPAKDKYLNVAIMTTDAFDAGTVDWTSVRFGREGTEAAPVLMKFKDKNVDGRKDLVLQFRVADTHIQCRDTLAKLTGLTKDNRSIVGSGAIFTKGCK